MSDANEAKTIEVCEYCDKALVDGCNEFGSIFDHEAGLERPCPNNDNQFPPRKI